MTAPLFPVFAGVAEAYRLVFGNLGAFCRAAFLPLLLSVAFVVAWWFATTSFWRPDYLSAWLILNQIMRLQLFTAAILVPWVLFAVSWHRFILLGPEAASPRWLPTPRIRHLRLFGYLVIGSLFFYLACLPHNAAYTLLITYPGKAVRDLILFGADGLLADLLSLLLFDFLFAVTAGYLCFRLALLMPAIAIDQAKGVAAPLSDAWRATRRQGYRLVAAWLLVNAPFYVINRWWILERWLIESVRWLWPSLYHALFQPKIYPGRTTLIWDGLGPVSRLLSIISAQLLDYLALALLVTLLSLAYRHVAGMPAPARPLLTPWRKLVSFLTGTPDWMRTGEAGKSGDEEAR